MTKTLVVFLIAVCAGAPACAGATDAADLFKSADFSAAKTAYQNVLRDHPRDVDANVGIGRLALYANDLDAAQAAAQAALAVDPNNMAATNLLHTIAGRREVEQSAKDLTVPPGGVVIPFVATDPLPLMRLTVDGHTANFMLDTGAPDFTLDPEFAHELGLTVTAGDVGTFAGGRNAQVGHAQLQTIDAGGLTLHDLHVDILPSRRLPFFGSTHVDGIVGTVFLSRFLATVDYPRGRLVLQPRTASLAASTKSISMPMWFVGDHFIFARGSVNQLEDQLFLIDSGLAGGGFSPQQTTIDAAHLKTFPDREQTGIGGGGPVKFIPVLADRLCLSSACQNNIRGMYTPGGSPLRIFPFAVAGVVSHEFLEHYAVTYDFSRMSITLTAPA